MQVELKIDAEAVQQKLVDSLIQSAIGEKITKAINDDLLKSDWNRGNAIDRAVAGALHDELRRMAVSIIHEQGDVLRERIKAAITDEAIQAAISSMVSGLWKDR